MAENCYLCSCTDAADAYDVADAAAGDDGNGLNSAIYMHVEKSYWLI